VLGVPIGLVGGLLIAVGFVLWIASQRAARDMEAGPGDGGP